MPHWGELFSLEVSALELIARTSIVYLSLVIALRVVGRRETGMELSDILMVVLISEGVGTGMYGKNLSVTGGLIVAGTLLGWSHLFDWLIYRFPLAQRILRGSPLKLVVNGRLQRRNMRRELVSEAELSSHLRSHGIEDFEAVKVAYLEPNGELSVIKKEDGKDQDDAPPRKSPVV